MYDSFGVRKAVGFSEAHETNMIADNTKAHEKPSVTCKHGVPPDF